MLPHLFQESNNRTEEEIQECTECLQKCEDMALDVNRTCPECLEGDLSATILKYEFVDVSNIKNFNEHPDKKSIVIRFYDETSYKYELSLDAFLKKFSQHANIY